MKQTTFFSFIVFILFNVGCSPKTEITEPIIGKTQLTIADGKLTPEALWAIGRIGEVIVSPDQQKIVYGIRYFSVALDKGNTDLYIMNIDGTNNRALCQTPTSEFNIQWSLDGKKIYFLSSSAQGVQLFSIDTNGQNRTQLSNVEGGLEGFKFSPDQKQIVYVQSVNLDSTASDRYPDLDKTTGIIRHDLMYKHWDEWKTSYPHLFVARFKQGKIEGGVDLLEGLPYEAPMKPHGGMEQINWSPNSKQIVYTCRKLKGKALAFSTNSDIFLYDLESRNTSNLSQGIMGYDMNPVFSPNGQYIAWESMERDGYEADHIRIMIYDCLEQKLMNCSENIILDTIPQALFDQNAVGFAWASNSQDLYFISDYHAREQIYSLHIPTKTIKALTQGVHNYQNVIPTADYLIGCKMSMSCPSDIYRIDLKTGKEEQLTFDNKEILDQLTMGKVEERWVKTTDKKEMLVWVIYPPNFDSTKTYPALLYCQGGPQSTVSQFWSVRWNFQIMAANDYIIVAPNRRGLPGFGKEWNEQISGDYSGQCMRDYLSAIDAISQEKYVDADRLGCVGASFGGYSVFWLAGNHNKRFKAFIAHDGMFNLEQQYLETEEMWFVDWDLKGAYWDKTNAAAQRTYANSPHRFVDRWDTPIMVIHGEKDYRILASQGMSAFNAAVLRDIPAELLIFPDENHWVLKPQNGILWQRRFFNWLDTYLK